MCESESESERERERERENVCASVCARSCVPLLMPRQQQALAILDPPQRSAHTDTPGFAAEESGGGCCLCRTSTAPLPSYRRRCSCHGLSPPSQIPGEESAASVQRPERGSAGSSSVSCYCPPRVQLAAHLVLPDLPALCRSRLASQALQPRIARVFADGARLLEARS